MNEADAMRDFDKPLLNVATTRRAVNIESHGESKVAIVPMHILDAWERRREEFFDSWRATAERINLLEDDAMELALEAVAAVRAEARAAKPSVIEQLSGGPTGAICLLSDSSSRQSEWSGHSIIT